MKRYFKWIALVLIIGSIAIISKLLISNELSDTSPDKDWLQRYKETSVKEEITTENGDIFVIDTYQDVYLVEKFIDIYQKVGEEDHLLIKRICADQLKLKPFSEAESGVQGYYLEDASYLIFKQKGESLYTVVSLGNNDMRQSGNNIEAVLPFVYDYMFETTSGLTRYDAMTFLVINQYDKGIQCLQQWAKGIFDMTRDQDFTEEEKALLVKESQQTLEDYNSGH